MKTLHPFQLDLKEKSRHALATHKRIIIQSATGSGKSVIMSSIVQSALLAGKTVLVLTETIKICEQLTAECSAFTIDSNSVDGYIVTNKAYVAMSQTIINRKRFMQQFNDLQENLLLIADECHINTMSRVIESFEHAYRIGFTATPESKNAPHLLRLYNHIIPGPQVLELISGGYLSPYKYFCRTSADTNELEIKRGEYTEKSSEAVFEKKKVYSDLFNDLKNIPSTKCMIFCSSIDHAEDTHRQLIMNGFRSCRYHSKLSKDDKKKELEMFTKTMQADICVSVAALNKGFDYKPIDLIILLMSTTSLARFLQSIGRGSRVIEGKKYFTILDYGDNWKRHGLYDEDRDWLELWQGYKKKGPPRASPVKSCPDCLMIVHASVMKCPDCGYIFPKKEVEQEEGKLIEITDLYNSIRGKWVSKLTPGELAIYARIKKRTPHAIRVAMSNEQKFGDFLDIFAREMGYKNSWSHMKRIEIHTQGPIYFKDYLLK